MREGIVPDRLAVWFSKCGCPVIRNPVPDILRGVFMDGMNATFARGLGAFKGEVEARAEFGSDERFQVVADARNVGFGDFASPIGRFRRELDEDFGFVHGFGIGCCG